MPRSIDERVRAEEAFGRVLMRYAGRWVAVQDHEVLDDDEELERLVGRLNGQRDTARIFQVPVRSTADICGGL